MSDASSVDKSRKARSAQDIIAAIAVAGLAFWAPGDDSGYFMRVVSAVLGVVGLLLASVGLEMFQEWRTRRAAPKSNPFEVKISRVDVPTAPPGGVFTAARNMSQHLEVLADPLPQPSARPRRASPCRSPRPPHPSPLPAASSPLPPLAPAPLRLPSRVPQPLSLSCLAHTRAHRPPHAPPARRRSPSTRPARAELPARRELSRHHDRGRLPGAEWHREAPRQGAARLGNRLGSGANSGDGRDRRDHHIPHAITCTMRHTREPRP